MNDFQNLEWELLLKPITISKVNDSKDLPKGPKKILINRDDNYKLSVTLYYNEEFNIEENKEGSFANSFEIQGYDESSRHYIFKHCIISRQQATIIPEKRYEANLIIGEILIKSGLEKEDAYLTEWYINGPREPLIFRRNTKRIASKGFRERSVNGEKFASIEAIESGCSISCDFLKVNCSDFQFLITKVPEGFGPEWSTNIGIEYRRDWGRIPNENERKIIGELCSFIFGRQLLLVGHTIYDEKRRAVEGYACNPWGDPQSICSNPDYPPIRIYSLDSLEKVEGIINQILTRYFELRNPIHLAEALWFYWISYYTPIGMGLPILWAGLEEIMHGWFDYKNSRSHGVYMPKGEFDTLLSCEINIIENKLGGQQYSDNIIKTIKNAYQLNVTDRLKFFFEEISMDVTKQEWDSMKSRHDVAHGKIDFDTVDWRSWIKKTQTFETLFHKTILKLLGYSGNYIDRSTEGWPDKKLN